MLRTAAIRNANKAPGYASSDIDHRQLVNMSRSSLYIDFRAIWVERGHIAPPSCASESTPAPQAFDA